MCDLHAVKPEGGQDPGSIWWFGSLVQIVNQIKAGFLLSKIYAYSYFLCYAKCNLYFQYEVLTNSNGSKR